MKFGITQLGHHTIIKMNAKLTITERVSLQDAYGHCIAIYGIGKGLTRIEGCMEHQLYLNSFSFEYKLAMKRSKITFAQIELDEMEETYQMIMNPIHIPLGEL